MRIEQEIKLWYKDERSNKVYHIYVMYDPKIKGDRRFSVEVRYGKRGAKHLTHLVKKDHMFANEAWALAEKIAVKQHQKGYGYYEPCAFCGR